MLYRSTHLDGEPIAVSGAIFIPPGPAPSGGRDIIAWAHPTSGVVEPCAPSLMPDLAGTIWGLAEMLARGYVVVATDYPGLGTPGIHPSVRARAAPCSTACARRAISPMPAPRTASPCGAHSQGGHASLYTGEIAATYAPDLKLVGVVAAAPATYLVELFDADKSSPAGKELTAMALYSWSDLYRDPASTLVDPPAMPAFEQLAHDCIESVAEFATIENAEKPLNREPFLRADPTEIEPWKSIMLRNTPGQSPAGAPVFLAQGSADTTVRPEITKQFGEVLCKQGTQVEYVVLPGVSHTFAAKDSVGQALNWITERFRGVPAPSVCE